MNKRIIIGIDCDDVLNNLIKGILIEHEKLTGVKYKEEDVVKWNLDCLDIEKNKVFPRIKPYELEPKMDNILALKRLYKLIEDRDDIKVYIVSQCPVEQAHDRIRFIKKYYPEFIASKFIAIEDKSLIALDYLVDDAVHNIEACSNNGTKTYLLDMPHNRKDNRFNRILNLDEFVNIIQKEVLYESK